MRRTTLLICLSTAALAGGVRSETLQIDLLTGLPITALEQQLPGCWGALLPAAPAAAPGKRVLWDLTHGVYLNYEPAGRFSRAARILFAEGFGVHTTTTSVASVNLSNWDILVVGIGSCVNGPYTAAEVSAIQAFVSNGGGLLVLGDNPSVWPDHIDPITQAFGTTTAVADIDPDDLFFSSFAPHPIFQGINQIYYRAAGELDGSPPSSEVAFTSLSEPVVNVVNGLRVVITGDINVFDNTYINNADNVPFLLNVFHYLGSGGTPQPAAPAGGGYARFVVSQGMRAELAMIWSWLLLREVSD